VIPPLVLRIVADSTGVKAGIANTQRQVSGLRGFMSRNSALLRTGGLAIAAGLAVGFKASFDAAVEAREAQLKLANSIKNSRVVGDEARDTFLAQAEALRQLTAQDDEAIIGAQAFLIQMRLTEEQVLALTPRIVDLSAKLGVDMETAAKAVGKSVNGTAVSLNRMGIKVDEAKHKVDPFKATLDALGGAAGFAAKKADAQPWEKLSSELGELAEKIGAVVIPIVSGLTRILTRVVEWINTQAVPWFSRMAKVVSKQVGPAFSDMWSTIRKDLWPALLDIWDAIQPLVKILGGALLTNLKATFKFFGFVAKVIGVTVEAVKDLVSWIGVAVGKLDTLASKIPGAGIVGDVFRNAIPFGNLIGRAAGGPVNAGQAYVVGERGPELFIPRMSGAIAAAGAAGVTINVYGDVNDAEKFQTKVVTALRRESARVGAI